MKRTNLKNLVALLTTGYNDSNRPRFMHYRKMRGGDGINLASSEIHLTDDDFDISEKHLLRNVKEYISKHAFNDNVFISDDVDHNKAILDFHATEIAKESRRGSGNIVVDDTFICYVGTNIEDNGLRIFKKDDMYALVPIDTLGGGNISLFKSYYRILSR